MATKLSLLLAVFSIAVTAVNCYYGNYYGVCYSDRQCITDGDHCCTGYDYCCPYRYICGGNRRCLSIGSFVGPIVGMVALIIGCIIGCVCCRHNRNRTPHPTITYGQQDTVNYAYEQQSGIVGQQAYGQQHGIVGQQAYGQQHGIVGQQAYGQQHGIVGQQAYGQQAFRQQSYGSPPNYEQATANYGHSQTYGIDTGQSSSYELGFSTGAPVDYSQTTENNTQKS